MAYHKNKHIEAAQKHLSQGKLPQAIAEYQQVLKHEPTDQIILMTVGDLFVRKGETFQAIEYFERLAQVFTRDGFLSKAIAIYKKIAKLAPEETRPLEKLAELYVQQGILSEARPIFLQLAEAHFKADRRESAAALLRKLLEAEPDNLRVHLRLAQIQQAMGNRADAAQTYLACAERQVSNLEPKQALELLDRARELAPETLAAKFIRARALAAAGRQQEAAHLLETIPGAESNDEVIAPLLELYLEQQRGDEAAALAERIFRRDPARCQHAESVARALLKSDEPARALAPLNLIRRRMAENGAHEALTSLLRTAAERLPDRLEPREWLAELHAQLDDAVHLPGALSQLGQVAAAAGNLERAREAYEQLLALVPADDTVRRNLDHIRTQLSLLPSQIPRPEPPREPVEEQKAPPPAIVEIPLDEETQKYVALSLTDVDLFSSYGLTQKAIDLLEKVTARAPRHAGALEKLLDLYLGEGNSQRTAELAEALARIHAERNDSMQAEKFHDLARRFERAIPEKEKTAPASAPTASVGTAPVEFALPEPAAVTADEIDALGEPQGANGEAASAKSESEALADEPHPAPADGQRRAEIREVDLSEEWAEVSGQLQHSVGVRQGSEPAQPAAAKAQDNQAANAPSEGEPEVAEERARSQSPSGVHMMLEALQASGMPAEAPAPPTASVIEMPVVHATSSGNLEPPEEVDYELELVESWRRVDKAEPNRLGNLASEVAASLGASPEEGAPPGGKDLRASEDAALAARARRPLRGASEPGGPLGAIFQEFREQLDQLETDEDPETHYNLGIAYREMGLLEEAISEFQKVAQAHDAGKPFKYAMQCCTLLGLSFMEKGQPEIATFWYERALRTPGLDAESVLALRYDLGLAQELGGQTGDALKSFQQVYAVNIDYRDVGERIRALRKQ